MENTAIIRRCPKKDKDDRPAKEQKYCLYNSKGDRLLGRHPSKEKALKQERAIQVRKHSAIDDEKLIQEICSHSSMDRVSVS